MYVCMYGGGKGVFLQKFKNHADGLWDGGTLVPRPRYRGQKTACAFSFLLPPCGSWGSNPGREASQQETWVESAFPYWHQRGIDIGAENKQMLKAMLSLTS